MTPRPGNTLFARSGLFFILLINFWNFPKVYGSLFRYSHRPVFRRQKAKEISDKNLGRNLKTYFFFARLQPFITFSDFELVKMGSRESENKIIVSPLIVYHCRILIIPYFSLKPFQFKTGSCHQESISCYSFLRSIKFQ